MNLLLLSDVYFPRVNGVSTSIRTFAESLSGMGHQVTIVAPDYGEASGQAAHDGGACEVIRLPGRVIFFDPEDRLLRASALRAVLPRLAQRHWDVIHIHTPRMGLDDNVRFFGNMDRGTELLDCYRAGDVFVFASPTETQGLVLIEAMALGVPIVSTTVMGTATVLRDAHCARISEEDVDAFASHVAHLLRSPAERAALSAAGPGDAQAWSTDGLMARAAALYSRLALARPAAVHGDSPRPDVTMAG